MRISAKLVVKIGSFVLVRIDEFRAVVGDTLQDGDVWLELFTDNVEEVDVGGCGAAVVSIMSMTKCEPLSSTAST